MSDEKPRSLDVVFTEVRSRLDKQFEQIESLNQRAGLLIGFVTLIMSLLAGFTTAVKAKDLPVNMALPVILILISTILYIHIIIFAYLAHRIQTYRRDPEPRPLRDNYLSKDLEATKRTVMSNFIESYEENKKVINKKVQALNKAFILFIVEAIYIVVLALAFFAYRMYAG